MMVLMEQFIIYTALILSGLCLGSFAGASVWRLRARQLVDDKASGGTVDLTEYKRLNKLAKTSTLHDRSLCLNCSYALKWYDMIPLISWLCLGGKCRKCRKPIGSLEPMIELGVMAFFVLSYAFWPYPLDSSLEIVRLVLWFVSGVGMAILFVYDAKWFLIPDVVNFTIIGIGLLSASLMFTGAYDKPGAIFDIFGSALILSGLYWLIYFISKGEWIGFGDVKLGLGLALLLADWKLAFIALFAANLIGCLIVIPAMVVGKLNRNSHVPFGPLLVIGFVIAGLMGDYLVKICFFGAI
jgi:leader peptidase (prepilin peptidase)/N-methyltransferase